MTQKRQETSLAYWRKRRGFTQDEMVRATGLSRATYGRLEQGRYENPPLRYLVNCAQVLHVPLSAVIDQRWRRWFAAGGVPNLPRWAIEKSLRRR